MENGQKMDRKWIVNKQKMIDIGQKLDRKFIENKQKIDSNYIEMRY